MIIPNTIPSCLPFLILTFDLHRLWTQPEHNLIFMVGFISSQRDFSGSVTKSNPLWLWLHVFHSLGCGTWGPFYFSLCLLDQQILLSSTFFVKLVLLYLPRLFEFSSTERKMKTFCLEQNQCQIFLLGCPCQDISMWHSWDCSDVSVRALTLWCIFLFLLPPLFLWEL